MEDDEILAALDEQPEAFALFYRRHVAGLLGYFMRRTRDAELAADLCAETFAAVLDGAHRFDPARGPPVAWLYRIARRLLAHAERRGAVEDGARRRLGMAPLDLTDAALERVEALAGSEVALAALDELPEDLVLNAYRYRCFSMVDVRSGRALMRIPSGIVTGIVPDGIDRVMLSAGGRTVTADVVDNVYQAGFDVPALPAGTPVTVELPRPGGDGCARTAAPELYARVAALRYAPGADDRLPPAALDVLRDWHWRFDAVLEGLARFWGADGGVDFWAVPVVPRGAAECAPAEAVCIVAVGDVRARRRPVRARRAAAQERLAARAAARGARGDLRARVRRGHPRARHHRRRDRGGRGARQRRRRRAAVPVSGRRQHPRRSRPLSQLFR
jgi:DNA-directed RNA polymerase specialized sigma24 family protein